LITHYHILNGASLKSQFPEQILGEKIIARECLVDGSVEGISLSELYESRWQFLNDNYGDCSKEVYYNKTVSEFEKVQNIPSASEVNLWFEDDLFCQVNFWFIINLMSQNHQVQEVFLIRPKINSEYSFGSMNEQELVTAFQNRIKIELLEIKVLSQLWSLYRQNDIEEMIKIARELSDRFPFLEPAINAHKERFAHNGKAGRPIQSLVQIMKAFGSNDFGKVFRAFCKQESIYGFSDLHVRRLFDEIINDQDLSKT
jgi:hypothetical protein